MKKTSLGTCCAFVSPENMSKLRSYRIVVALLFGDGKPREQEPKKMGDTNNISRTGGSG